MNKKLRKVVSDCNSCKEICKATHDRKSCPLYRKDNSYNILPEKKKLKVCIELDDIKTYTSYELGFNHATDIMEQKLKGKVIIDKEKVERLEEMLETKWNHLFNPEESYIGRYYLSQSIKKHLGVSDE